MTETMDEKPIAAEAAKNVQAFCKRTWWVFLLSGIAAVVFGWVSYNRLPIELMPDISYPTITVRTAWDGAAPQEVENRVSRPVEEALAMPVERIISHPEIRQTAGQIALQRGPIVYCLEEADNGKYLNDLLLPAEAQFSIKTTKDGIFKDIPLIKGTASRRKANEWGSQLYQTTAGSREEVTLTAVPYFMWANREAGEMLIWIRKVE